MVSLLFLLLFPLLADGLPSRARRGRLREGRQQTLRDDALFCDRGFQQTYCDAPFGGDLHTACRYCGIGLSCPIDTPTGRGLDDRPGVMAEILQRHNDYREEVRRSERAATGGKARCIPELK